VRALPDHGSFIECGETRSCLGLSNCPKSVESYAALHELVLHVIDPVIEYFGMVELTYGFCSWELSRQISRRIDPSRDQHCAHEVDSLGRRICERGGAAVDFLVRDTDMAEVANWVRSNTRFDRIYYYGSDRPLHVSYGSQESAGCFRMVDVGRGRRLPLRTESF
jgi:hypothetical protein